MTNPAPEIDYAGAGKRLLERCIAAVKADPSRQTRDQQDWKNLLYYRGGSANQWIVWDGSRYITKPTSGAGAVPEWVPRCATNDFAVQIDGISAILDQSSPAQEWRPATDDDEDVATADVIRDVMPVLREESGFEDIRPLIHKYIALCDKVAVVVYFDDDPKYGEKMIQALRCQACGQAMEPGAAEDNGNSCPACGAGEELLGLAIDEQANPIGTMYPVGRLRAEILLSAEFSLPPRSRTLMEDRLPYILVHSRWSHDDALAMWGAKAKAMTESTRSGALGMTLTYADNLAGLSGPLSAADHGGGGAAKSSVVYRLYHDPIEDGEFTFPEGLYVAMGEDGTVLEAGPLPLKDDQGRPIKNIAIRTFMPIPGTAFGKPPADDLSQLQTQLNLTETLAFMILMSDSAPTTWLPDTVTVVGDVSTVPGAINRFRSHNPGDRPVPVPGQGFPESLKWWLDRIDAKMAQLSKLNAVLLGQRPAGDPTLGEVELLREQGLGAFKTPLDQLVAFEKRVSMLLLHVSRQSMWAPRYRRVRGENGQWEISQFTAADLAGGVDVYVDPSSAWPKSLLVQQMRMEKAVEIGLLQPAMDPELQVKMLSNMNLADLKPSLDIDRKQIAREIDRWKAATLPAEIGVPDLPAINIQMHAFYKAQFLRTELAEAMKAQNPPVYQAMLQHVMMLQQAMMPPAPPAPGGEKGKPGAALNEAVESGALSPAGAGGSSLDTMLASGALQPAGSAEAQAAVTGPSMDELMASGALTPTLGKKPGQEARV